MTLQTNKLVSCLWFDSEAEEAARFYCSVFKNSKMGAVTHYGKEGFEFHRQPEGKVMTADFELEGQRFVGLNGGPVFKHSEAISFQILCDDQAEVDYYWAKLTADGGAESNCGWLKDKYGLSWQVVPKMLIAAMTSGDAAKVQRMMKAFMQMNKYDIATLERAAAGTP
jgi:predicted 3-demethylubiquinone-9 3-methyltransferase (glyoxalase superfamily)